MHSLLGMALTQQGGGGRNVGSTCVFWVGILSFYPNVSEKEITFVYKHCKAPVTCLP